MKIKNLIRPSRSLSVSKRAGRVPFDTLRGSANFSLRQTGELTFALLRLKILQLGFEFVFD